MMDENRGDIRRSVEITDGFKYILFIREIPMILLGEKIELARIYSYFTGFYHAELGAGTEIHPVFKKFMGSSDENFQSFVCSELKIHSNKPWYEIIEYAAIIPSEALRRFYQLLDSYLEKWSYDLNVEEKIDEIEG